MTSTKVNASGDKTAETEEPEMMDDDLFVDVDGLQSYGINVADIKKLKSGGVCTLKGLRMVTKKKLCGIKGLSEAKVDKIREAVTKLEGANVGGFVTALQVQIKALILFLLKKHTFKLVYNMQSKFLGES